MDVLKTARDALAMIREGRQALASVADAVKDGAVALATTDREELNRLLAEEEAESRAAHDSLEEAIREAEARG